MDLTTIAAIVGPTSLVAMGAAYGGVKVALNGTKDRVLKLELAKDDHTDRLARIETKIDVLLEKD